MLLVLWCARYTYCACNIDAAGNNISKFLMVCTVGPLFSSDSQRKIVKDVYYDLLRDKAVKRAVGFLIQAHNLTCRIDPEGEGLQGPGNVNRVESTLVAQENVRRARSIDITADAPARCIH